MPVTTVDGTAIRAALQSYEINQQRLLNEPETVAEEAGRLISNHISSSLSSTLRQFMQLQDPGLLVEGCHEPPLEGETPSKLEPAATDPHWAYCAAATLGLMNLLGLRPISYACENDGHLFVHLTAMPSGSGLLTKNSRDEMTGHTDALSFPFADEYDPSEGGPSPAPDFVILTGLRNPDKVPTYVASLEEMQMQLSPSQFAELEKPVFAFHSQNTFKCDHVNLNKPVIHHDSSHGMQVRFSQGKVHTDRENTAALAAKDALSAALRKSRAPVVVKPGDIFFVNNRTSLHGRGVIKSEEIGGMSRWIMRTYGYMDTTQGTSTSDTAKHMMNC